MNTFIHRYRALKAYVLAHKVISGIVIVVILLGGWWMYAKATSTSGEVRYVLGTVSSGTIIATVSESGQVSASDTLNVTAQNASGQLIGIYVTPGETVKAGQSIATIDPTTAEQALTSAKENLQSAQLSLAMLQEPPTTLTLTQQQDALTQAQQQLATLYQSSFNDVTNTFLDLPTIISGLQDIDLGSEASPGIWNIDYYKTQAGEYNTEAQSYRDAAYNDYETARASYDQTFNDFKSVSSTPDQATITSILTETYKTTGLIATAAKSANDLIQFYSDQLTQYGATPKSVAATQITNLNTYLSKAQNHLTTLLSDANNITSDAQSITEKQQTLQQTQAGPDALSIEQSQLSVQKAQDSLTQAEQNLSYYYITAPFSGTIASVPVNKYDQAGSGTTIATLVTAQQYADLSLNEVDAAKIQLGDKATITFDAIPDLTLTGTVAQINPVGTVSQGVVTYDVKLSFDAQDSRIKTGMSVNADIETAVHQSVLEVPSSAVHTLNGQSYVLAFNPPLSASGAGSQGVVSATAPTQIPVTVGISDDTNTEITSGLILGTQIVTRTTSGSTPVAITTGAAAGGAGAAGGLRGGAGGGFGGGIRIGG